MSLTQQSIDRIVDGFQKDLERAETLYERIALGGGTKSDDAYSPLQQPDRRDAAQFIFFEAAAKFETFCNKAFKVEVRYEFKVLPKRADFIMGNIDRGLGGVMGWGSPNSLRLRARALFGKKGFFARIDTRLESQTYLRLTQAHKVRNRIAHTEGKASAEFNAILGQLGVPLSSRRGLSVGRLLMDYPTTVQSDDRWFHRFIGAYRAMLDGYRRYMRNKGQ